MPKYRDIIEERDFELRLYKQEDGGWRYIVALTGDFKDSRWLRVGFERETPEEAFREGLAKLAEVKKSYLSTEE